MVCPPSIVSNVMITVKIGGQQQVFDMFAFKLFSLQSLLLYSLLPAYSMTAKRDFILRGRYFVRSIFCNYDLVYFRGCLRI